ncbi:unnamed protein product [Prorocentrum cordatum]|uniref:V-SNARE coiled-coil homology domain-containing protein n=1 Tax=Prorocentrum cordatum TaxID=2364126 RepID=A0ABN9PQ76_9DINO|nr:unnamed protein product [Polarella glacialis]
MRVGLQLGGSYREQQAQTVWGRSQLRAVKLAEVFATLRFRDWASGAGFVDGPDQKCVLEPFWVQRLDVELGSVKSKVAITSVPWVVSDAPAAPAHEQRMAALRPAPGPAPQLIDPAARQRAVAGAASGSQARAAAAGAALGEAAAMNARASERGERLGSLGDKSSKMADDAKDFLEMAKQLNAKQSNRWF